MDNLFTILRFFVPGCLFGLQIYSTSLIISSEQNQNGSTFLDFSSGVAFLVIVSVGFLSSVIYRQFYPIHKLDHISTVNYLLQSGLISVINTKEQPIEKLVLDRSDSREDAYQILTIIWHQNIEKFDGKKGEYQGNLINSMGSALIALILGLIASLVLFFETPQNIETFLLSLHIQVIIILLVQSNFNQVKRFYLGWIDSTIISKISLMDEQQDKEFLTKIIYFYQKSPNISSYKI